VRLVGRVEVMALARVLIDGLCVDLRLLSSAVVASMSTSGCRSLMLLVFSNAIHRPCSLCLQMSAICLDAVPTNIFWGTMVAASAQGCVSG
jgi:hypothetical protein